MFCIKCGHKKTQTTNSRQASKKASIWRRRRCLNCGFTFTTYEEIALDRLSVLRAPKKTESFNDTRLLLSIYRSLEHEPEKRAEYAKWLTQHVTTELIKHNGESLPIASIIETTYQTLARFDLLASIQYAARHKDELKSQLRRLG